MKTGIKVLIGVLVIAAVIGGIFVSGYNKLVSYDESIKAAWSQVENVMQRRNDLIPNLVNTVKGYAKHEKEIFENVANARAALAGAKTIDEKVQASSTLDSALGRLLAIAENYPQLQANKNFQSLMDELAGSENRIAVERRRYNEIVQAYNITVRKFPSNIIASMFGFKEKQVYFKADEKAKEVPQVKF
ncbi:MAG: LemA family protein [Candidatus Goldbacteria bacterium]|nr:LemA family protein [Candidatus Goldiibacteriota bacterium]HPD19030.1 LemA family protein [Candidatus Goldiibacteriota bacterium]